MSESREFQDGEVISGTRYRVLRLIGVGGMGSVYEVEHLELGKRFVLKALLRELARREDLAQRLRNEWRALARLQHDNIVNVTDAGTSAGGVPFYVMERLDGDTLAALLRKRRRLHVLEAVGIAASVLDALSAAHDIGIIHRDVKPANVFIASGGAVKLLDFGIAKIADATSVVTARGLAVGTPRYMSPEQARGERVDGRSDVYASALILFEMIAGVGPFDDARDHNELLLAHLAREAPPLSSLVMGVSPELERIVSRMLAKDVRERPAHARDGAQQLRDFAARLRYVPTTDAPTVQADYAAQTVAAARRPTPNPLHDSVTRAEGPAQQRVLAEPNPSDVALTQRMLRPEPSQVTATINSSEPFSVSSVPNTTFMSPPPSVDGSTTLEMARHFAQSGYTARMLMPPPARLPSSSPVERPERTEFLGEFAPPPPGDALPTRTRVPLPERARPISITPPPVVDTGRGQGPTASRSPGRTRLALFAAAAAAVLLVGVLARRPRPPADHSPASASLTPPAAPNVPVPVPAPAPAAPTLAAPKPATPVPPASDAFSAPPTAPIIRTIPSTKRFSSDAAGTRSLSPGTASGPFLRAIPLHAATAQPAQPAMPASGL